MKDLVQFTHMSCRELGGSNIVFCGGFVNHPLTRKMITQEWLGIDGMISNIQMKEVLWL